MNGVDIEVDPDKDETTKAEIVAHFGLTTTVYLTFTQSIAGVIRTVNNPILVQYASEKTIECNSGSFILPSETLHITTSVLDDSLPVEFEFPELNDTGNDVLLENNYEINACGSRTYTLAVDPNLSQLQSGRTLHLFTDDLTQISEYNATMSVALESYPNGPQATVPILVTITETRNACKNYGFDSNWSPPSSMEVIIGQYNFYTFEHAYTEYEIETASTAGNNLEILCGKREYSFKLNGNSYESTPDWLHVVSSDEINSTKYHFDFSFSSIGIMEVVTDDESLKGTQLIEITASLQEFPEIVSDHPKVFQVYFVKLLSDHDVGDYNYQLKTDELSILLNS